jgi:glycerophosphoryl diester phosphodiesterase
LLKNDAAQVRGGQLPARTRVILIHALLFLAFWLTNLSYQKPLNDFLVGATGMQVNFLLIFMIFAGLVALWSAARLVMRRSVRWTDPAGIFFLVFFYASFTILFLKNSAQLFRLGQLFQYFRLILDAGVLLLLAWGLRRRVKNGSGKKKALASAGLLIIWLIPVFYTPWNVYRGVLPEKPRLVAHRGAATLAPENTLASMQAAAGLGVYSLETDISVSADGVLFLMHDSTLARTTDVARVFPGRENDPAESFKWNELSQLNAGSWFDRRGDYSGEPIMTLEAMLQVVRENNLYFIYDLRIPSAAHAYAGQALDLCLEEIQTAGVADHTWVLAKPDEIAQIQSILPAAILTAGIGYYENPPSPAALAAGGYQVVNSVYSLSNRRIHDYQEAGLWVNLWLVDEPWQYSRLWLAGANSVTSNYVQTFSALSRPVAAIPYPVYLSLWVGIGLLAACLYLFRRSPARGREEF